jgi:nicotinate-nucleotide adenylyltransferase
MTPHPISWSEVSAIFGGTFDPPHLGHRGAALGLLKNPGVREVVILPSATPPHKAAQTTAEERSEMARLGFPIDSMKEFRLDLREIERATRTGKPSYSYDTLVELRRELPKLAFVIGTDQLEGLSRWHRFPEVIELCHWIVLERKPEGQAAGRRALAEYEASGLLRRDKDHRWTTPKGMTLTTVETAAPALSSTAIREEIARSGTPPPGSISPEIETYLKRHRLYGSRGT